MKLLFFDLEIAYPFDSPLSTGDTELEGDIWESWPFGVSVGATKVLGQEPIPRFDQRGAGEPELTWSQEYTEMFVEMLRDKQREGYKLFTWNGTGFDWKLLAHITQNFELCSDLAMHSYDPYFQVLCMMGYGPGLDKCGKMVGSLPKEMDGMSAPVLWHSGAYEDVIEYVCGDVVRLEDIIVGVMQRGGYLIWETGKGGVRSVNLSPLLTVEQCLELPLPDTSWMETPRLREEVIHWFFGELVYHNQ